MALTESQNSGRQAWAPLAGLTGPVRSWLSDSGDRSIAQKIAGAAFLIRVFSAGLIYLSQILLARWMGSFEFGIYVYVWTLVSVIGDLSDLGFATSAQRFVPEYAKRGAFDLLRGFLSRSRWVAVGSATVIAATGIVAVRLLEPHLTGYLVCRSRSRLRRCRVTLGAAPAAAHSRAGRLRPGARYGAGAAGPRWHSFRPP